MASRVWGVNSYYDYRKTRYQHYNQVSLGIESLGRTWDFRINGYLPVSPRTSSFSPYQFDGFEDHYLVLAKKREFSMGGANAEVGAHINKFKNVPLYFAGGPYYLTGKNKTAWGGEARIAIDFFDYVRLEGSTSYDNLFKWIGQGQISLNIPLGNRAAVRANNNRSCSREMALRQRAVQPVYKNEIIPVEKQTKKKYAINPATGLPYTFWFVDNTSGSDGTFADPFPTLVEAENISAPYDIIYVFAGDGTANGLDNGITLKDNQKLLGGGIDQILVTTDGRLTIPILANGFPIITKSGDGVVICANNNEISGIHLFADVVQGIECIGIRDAYIHDNLIQVNGMIGFVTFGVGVHLNNNGGDITIVRNAFDLQ